MISKAQIKYLSGAASYVRGQDIYRTGKVLDMDIQDVGASDEIIASVQGSGRNIYEVDISVNKEENEIESSYCDCPAYGEYSGICKHCVAVLLEYNNYVVEQRKAIVRENLEQMNGVKKGMKMRTTPELAQLLQKQAVAKSLPLIQESTYGKVRLEPSFTFDGRNFYVEFKIGAGKLYVLKDVFTFDQAMADQENYKYGKNLQFVHTEESFDEESRPLVKFIRKWVQDHKALYRPGSLYGYYGSSMEKTRHISLKGNELAEFLLLMEGRTLNGEAVGEYCREWQITTKHLPRKIKITGSEQGIELSVSKFLSAGITEKYRIYFYGGWIFVENAEDLLPVADFMDSMTAVRGERAFISNSDVPAFCKDLLPVLQEFYECEVKNFDPADYGMLEPEFKIYLDAPQENMITCRPEVYYGEKQISLYTTEEIAMRDMAKEAVLRKVIHEYSNAFDPDTQSSAIVDDDEMVYDLLMYGIPAMQALGEVFVSEALKRMEIKSAPKITVGVSLNGNLLELTLTAGEMSKDELIDILSRYNRKKKFYRLKDRSFINAEDSGLDTVAELKTGLQLTDKQMKQDAIEVQKYRALYLDGQLKESPFVATVKDKAFRSLVRNMKTVEDNDFEVPESLDKILREYQKRGFLWIKTLNYNGFGGILADDMGLGKTLQVIAFLLSEFLERNVHMMENEAGLENDTVGDVNEQYEKKQRNALIVAPASLVYNWSSEIQRFAPELTAKMVTGTATERRKILAGADSEDILLTSYDLLKRDISEYEKYKFRCEIIDEAQYIKNANTQAAKAVKEVQADFRLALTGTPVENRLSELWSIFDYLMPGFLYSYKKFREEVEIPAVQNSDEDAMKRLQKMIRPFVLRRLKKEVLTDLPDKLEENMFVQLTGEQQKLYDAHVKRMMLMLDKQSEEEFKTSKITILAELTKLRQICCDPSLVFADYKDDSAKVDMCLNMISNAVESGHKILLFSQFTTMLDHLAKRLEQEKISYYMLTGSTNKEKRAQMVENFNKDETQVFCVSLKAGGTGLNLTAADIVIHFDPWWNLAVQNQATDRAHRIGQKNVVNVYKLIVKDTIEENIVKLQEKKRELADQILEGEGLNGGSFTKEELMELLSGK